MKKEKVIPFVSATIETTLCECGHVVPVDEAMPDDEGTETCKKCYEEIVAYMRKFRPVLFSTEMVQAVLDGRKTKTRRTKGLEKINEKPDDWRIDDELMDNMGDTHAFFYHKETNKMVSVKCPFGAIGSGLYVRENWKLVGWDFIEGEVRFAFACGSECVVYKNVQEFYIWAMREIKKMQNKDIVKYIDNEDRMEFTGKHHPFSPGIHLPKWGSRIWLQITGIRVERLHSITEKDIIAEGVQIPVSAGGNVLYKVGELNTAISFLPKQSTSVPPVGYVSDQIYFAHWAELWCKINGRASWDANPWVWVVEFKQVEKPE